MVKKIFAKSYLYLILLLMYIPVFTLIVFSFTETTLVGTWDTFSLNLYVKLFQNKKIMEALGNTLLVGFTSAIVSTILGTLGAIGTFYSSKKFKHISETINQIPVVNAEIVMALSLAVLFVAFSWKNGFFTLLIGHVVLTISFVYLNVKPKLKQMDANMYEAALDLGCTPNQALVKVILPEILPGIVSGFMLAFTLSLDDYVITAFTRDNSFNTLSTYVQGVIVKSSIPPELRALTTIIFLFAIAILIINNFTSKKSHKSRVRTKKGNM